MSANVNICTVYFFIPQSMSADIYPRDAFGESGGYAAAFECIGQQRLRLGGDISAVTVIAEYRHLVAGDTVYARDVDKALIHKHRDHMRHLAAYQHRCVHLGKAEGEPVAVADAYGRDARVLIERQPFAVAETIPGTAHMHGGDIAAP